MFKNITALVAAGALSVAVGLSVAPQANASGIFINQSKGNKSNTVVIGSGSKSSSSKTSGGININQSKGNKNNSVIIGPGGICISQNKGDKSNKVVIGSNKSCDGKSKVEEKPSKPEKPAPEKPVEKEKEEKPVKTEEPKTPVKETPKKETPKEEAPKEVEKEDNGKGVVQEEPVKEAAPVVEEIPAELPRTGISAGFLTTLFGAIGTYGAVYLYRLRK